MEIDELFKKIKEKEIREMIIKENLLTLKKKVEKIVINKSQPYSIEVKIFDSNIEIEMTDAIGVDIYLTKGQIELINKLFGENRNYTIFAQKYKLLMVIK